MTDNYWNAEKNEPAAAANPDFISCVKCVYNAIDTTLVTCRSGGDSALAVNDLNSACHGKHMKTGRKVGETPEHPGPTMFIQIFYGFLIKHCIKEIVT